MVVVLQWEEEIKMMMLDDDRLAAFVLWVALEKFETESRLRFEHRQTDIQ